MWNLYRPVDTSVLRLAANGEGMAPARLMAPAVNDGVLIAAAGRLAKR